MTDRERSNTTGDDSTDALTDDHTPHTKEPTSDSRLTAFTDGGER